ncbi:MAG: hypothetical protein U9Q83_07750, partial [Bacteroidota bacterium]|nr:hypothetical protein [Bacteroidota bacterium]
MKKIIILILFSFPLSFFGQQIDSLKVMFIDAFTNQDTNIYFISEEISNYYKHKYPDSSLYYCNYAIEFAKKNEHRDKYLKFKILKAEILAFSYQYYEALENYNSVIRIVSNNINTVEYSKLLNKIAEVQIKAGISNDISKKYLEQSIEISKYNKNIETEAISYALLSKLFSKNSNFDSAFHYINKTIPLLKNSRNKILSAKIF